jgi:hypothetical protein
MPVRGRASGLLDRDLVAAEPLGVVQPLVGEPEELLTRHARLQRDARPGAR